MANRRTLSPPAAPAKAVTALPPDWFRNLPGLLIAAFIVAFAVFEPALHGSLIFDDFHLPFADPKAGEMPARFWIGGVRPILNGSYWANFAMSGTETFSYHAVNVILHALTAFVVLLLLERVLSLSGAFRNPTPWAIAGAAIFLVHPLQTESVDYIAGRSEIMAGLFLCSAWLVFLRHFESETSVLTSVKILLLAGAAVLSKESAICLPAILIATDFYYGTGTLASRMRRRMKLYVPFLLGAAFAAVLILRTLTRGTGAGFSSGTSPFEYLLTQCKSILIYIRLFFIPAGQNGDWQMPFFHSPGDSGAWLYALAMLVTMGLTVWLFPRLRLASFGLAVFFLLLSPTSSIVPIKDAMAERRMYVPIAGLILLSIALVSRLNLSGRGLMALAAAAVSIFAAIAWSRSAVWTGPIAFWRDAAEKNPGNYRAHFGLGSALFARNDCRAAVLEFNRARPLIPSDHALWWNLASAYQCMNEPGRALPLFREFADAQPSADAWNRVAYEAALLGKEDESFSAIEKALRLNPENAVSYAYRGLGRLATDNVEGARTDFERALQLDPGNTVAQTGMRSLPGPKTK